jgi:hypothetical protein
MTDVRGSIKSNVAYTFRLHAGTTVGINLKLKACLIECAKEEVELVNE